MSDYVAHLADGDTTACGEPWQGWQAPRTDTYELTPGTVELPPHDQPRPSDRLRQCQACVRATYGGAARDA